jgi:hypothetical protein
MSKYIIKRGVTGNPYDHDMEYYSAIYLTRFKASCSRGQLKRRGWIVKAAIGSGCYVKAMRRVK